MKPAVKRQLDRRDFFRSVGAAAGAAAVVTRETPDVKAATAAALPPS